MNCIPSKTDINKIFRTNTKPRYYYTFRIRGSMDGKEDYPVIQTIIAKFKFLLKWDMGVVVDEQPCPPEYLYESKTQFEYQLAQYLLQVYKEANSAEKFDRMLYKFVAKDDVEREKLRHKAYDIAAATLVFKHTREGL